jgi:hypothetical protein
VCNLRFVQVSDRAERLIALRFEPGMHVVGIVRWSIVTVELVVMVVVSRLMVVVKVELEITGLLVLY